MSGENSVDNNPSLGSYLAFPAATAGFGALTALKRADWKPSDAIKNLEIENFKKLGVTLKDNGAKDIFSRGTALAKNYEAYKSASKEAYKWGKRAKKAAKGKIGLKDTILNFFRKDNKVTVDTIKEANEAAAKKLSSMKKNLSQGKEIAEEIVENSAKTAAKTGFKETAKGLAKKELTSKFNLFISVATTFIPAMKDKVIPAFKNEGFISGIKELGKAAAQTATDFIGYAFGGAIGRTIGTALCPGAGSFIGGNLGDMIGSMFIGGKTMKAVNKLIKADDGQSAQKASDEAQQISQNNPQIQAPSMETTKQSDTDNTAVAQGQSEEIQPQPPQKDFSNIPSFEEAQKMGLVKAPSRPKTGTRRRKVVFRGTDGFYKNNVKQNLVTNNKQNKFDTIM